MKETDFPTKNCRSAKKIAQLRQEYLVRQVEVPKSKFTYHTEGQFHFGFNLFH